ncbi:MAG TPA: protein YgfX [Steroidobacteraceae bacterium]|nr:protein YgfX [Steroidobacteraceae bacterium]
MSDTRLELSRSWALAAAILLLHGAAAASILTILQGAAGIALAAAVLLLGIAAVWGRALHGSSVSVRAIELSGNEITLELQDGRRLRAELSASRHVSRIIVTLPVHRPVRRTVLVTRDMLRAEEFRRLRLWALWGKVPVASKQLTA